MRLLWIANRGRLDRMGLLLSGLCALHCVAGIVLIAALGFGGGFLFEPAIHRGGLLVATLVVAVAIGLGALRHRRTTPFAIAIVGLAFMASALAVPHGVQEAVLTIIGVALVAAAHVLNLRRRA